MARRKECVLLPRGTATTHCVSVASRRRACFPSCEAFNKDDSGKGKWIKPVQELGLLPTPTADAVAVAHFLHRTPGLDKALIGEYISKGPPDRYPFNGIVLKDFCTGFEAALSSSPSPISISRLHLPSPSPISHLPSPISHLPSPISHRLSQFE